MSEQIFYLIKNQNPNFRSLQHGNHPTNHCQNLNKIIPLDPPSCNYQQ